MLDLYTIRSELGRLSGLRVLMVGDLRHGRTVHSLSRLLAMYGAELLYLAPEGLGMPSEVQVRACVCERGGGQSVALAPFVIAARVSVGRSTWLRAGAGKLPLRGLRRSLPTLT